MPRVLEHVAVPILEQLVVGRARDDLDLELRNRVVVDDAAQRAGRKDVGVLTVDLRRPPRRVAPVSSHHALHPLGVDVGDDQLRAGRVQLARQMVADIAAALNRHGLARQVVAAPAELRRRLHGAKHAVRRDGRRIARRAPQSGDVVRLHVHEVHVERARADVFGRHIATAERIDEATVRAKDHLAIGGLLSPMMTTLAAAEVEAGHGVLVRHAARQAQRVDDRLLIGGVVPEARAAERGPERRVVDRDDAAVAGGLVVGQTRAARGPSSEIVSKSFIVLRMESRLSGGGNRDSCHAARIQLSRESRCAALPTCLRRSP